MPSVVRGKGRGRTLDLFATAVANPRRGELPILLVDSEESVEEFHTSWQHLAKRDAWKRPAGATDDQVFLMVQVMETWFLSDRDLLRTYFDTNFNERAVEAWPALEAVPKRTIFEVLDRATAACSKRYSKGKVSYQLLSRLNPAVVEASCPHAKRLLDHLRSMKR
jgi:hypothetical protein